MIKPYGDPDLDEVLNSDGDVDLDGEPDLDGVPNLEKDPGLEENLNSKETLDFTGGKGIWKLVITC